MDKATLNKLAEAIDDVAKCPEGPWQERRYEVVRHFKSLGEWAESSLEEFLSWFGGEIE